MYRVGTCAVPALTSCAFVQLIKKQALSFFVSTFELTMATGNDGGALEGSAPLTQADIPAVVKAVVDQLKDQLPPRAQSQSREGGDDAPNDPLETCPSSRAGKYNRALRLAARYIF